MSNTKPLDRSVTHLRPFISGVATIVCLFISTPARGDDEAASQTKSLAEQPSGLQLLPAEVQLIGPAATQRIIAVETAGQSATPLPGRLFAEDLQWEMKDPSVARIEKGIVAAAGNGTTELIGKSATGLSAVVRITVTDFDQHQPTSFRNQVEPILARRGCSMGACHGALAGKGGFRLSLRGYDPAADWLAITREALGRRIELADPGRSLLLAKPTGALPHKGGLRLDVDDPDYHLLAQWIAEGALPPTADDPQLTKISVLPENSMLGKADVTQILVQAHYDDGHVVDVTHWAKFSATDEAVASVNDDGRVEVRGSGQGAVLAWFGSKVALARLTVPFEYQVDQAVYVETLRRNFIDDLVLEQLKTLNLAPSDRCSDETFVRRATLDTIGRLPSLEETTAFLADPSTDKRDRYIETLLGSEDFVDYWTYKWSDLLLVTGEKLRPDAIKAYYQWIRQNVADNVPWDQFVRKILTATGSTIENGATNFYAIHQDPENMTENAAQAFLGLSIGCAKCHNHPLEKWTNDQYYAMANLFARVRGKGWGGDSRSGNGHRTVYVASSGDLIQPNKGKAQPPAPLDATPLDPNDPSDRRQALADWLVSPENPYFSRAITNRVWKNFYGVALVEEPDDLRLSNPASNEPLLAAAADYLAEQNFDLKMLMREILQSETYQRSSLPLANNRDDQRYYSRYYPRRMMAEVMLDQIDQTLGTVTKFDTIAFPGADKVKTDFYPEGTRAIELYDSAVESYFLTAFGRNSREITCECQRSDEPSMVQVLHLSNGDTMNQKLQQTDNHIGRWIEEGLDNAQILDRLFLTALCRQPQATEREQLLAVIEEYGEENRRAALEDAFWSVLTSSEFLFNQ